MSVVVCVVVVGVVGVVRVAVLLRANCFMVPSFEG